MRRKKSNIPYMIMFTLVSLGAFFMFVPYLWMVLSSFKSNLEIIEGAANILPKNPSLDGYKTVLTEAPFLRWLMNSFFTSVSTTVFTLFTSALAGYIFLRNLGLKAKGVLFSYFGNNDGPVSSIDDPKVFNYHRPWINK